MGGRKKALNENLQGKMHVFVYFFYLKTFIKHARFHVFSPFSAWLYLLHYIMVKGLLNPDNRIIFNAFLYLQDSAIQQPG